MYTEKPPGTPSGTAVEIRNRFVSGGAFIPPFGGSLTREREGRGRNFSFTVLRLFFWLQKKSRKYRPADGSTEEKSVRGAGAPSPPSEEGGGCLHKGFEQADGGRDTPSMCESSRYSRQKKQMTAFSLGARLPLGANSRLRVISPSVICRREAAANASSLLRGSRGGYRRKPQI